MVSEKVARHNNKCWKWLGMGYCCAEGYDCGEFEREQEDRFSARNPWEDYQLVSHARAELQ
jgi:hypothetical protein